MQWVGRPLSRIFLPTMNSGDPQGRCFTRGKATALAKINLSHQSDGRKLLLQIYISNPDAGCNGICVYQLNLDGPDDTAHPSSCASPWGPHTTGHRRPCTHSSTDKHNTHCDQHTLHKIQEQAQAQNSIQHSPNTFQETR